MKTLRKNFFILLLLLVGLPNNFLKANYMSEKTSSKTFIMDSSREWENVDKGVFRKILGYDGQLMMVKIRFNKGAVGTQHTHYHTQATYIVSGMFEFTIDGKKKIVKAGDALYMAPDVKHGCVCLEEGLLVDCFSPIRTDFLKK